MQKKFTILQDGNKECGSACLMSIIRYYGGNIPNERIVSLTNTTKDGTNFYDLMAAGKEVGLTAKGYKIDSTDELLDINSPFISQVVINNYHHFVVVYKINDKFVTLMDPAKGMVNIKISEFSKLWTGYILVMIPYKKLPIYKEDNYINKILKRIIYDNKKLIIHLIVLTILVMLFTTFYGYHFKILIDNVVTTSKFNLLIVSIIFLIILFMKSIMEYLRNNLILYLNQKIDLSIITNTINKIISLPYSYYRNKTTGEVIARVNDLFYIKNVIAKIITSICLDMVMALGILIILFIINKNMTLLVLIITIIYLLIFYLYKGSIKKMTDIIQEDNAKVNSLLVESVSSYNTIKGLNIEKEINKKINYKYLELSRDNIFLNKLTCSEDLLKDIFEGIIILIIIYLGVSYVMDKNMTLGSLITYNSLLYCFLLPVRNSMDFYYEYYYVKNSIKRINNILNYKYEKLDKKSELSLDGNIKINNLVFSHNPKKVILKGLNLKINKGDKVMILGSSGSGKSTLLKLLYRFYQIERDKIYINDFDINDFTILDIRSGITYVSQNEYLYTDTIRNNIILDREISDREFIDVCRLTKVSDFVTDNDYGYDFPLEENGANISGGQRQRIILARAMLKKGNIILIDEGLNEIDISLEREILKNIFSYYKDKTFIIVSHRLDNMDLYNRVIRLDNGYLKEVNGG